MSDQAILETLKEVAFFEGMDESDLSRLAGIAKTVEFPANADIFKEFDLAKDVFVIISGEVSLVSCTPASGCRKLMTVQAGEMLGWSPLVGRPRLHDTAHTLSPINAIVFDGQQILTFCEEHPKFGFQFMHRAAKVLAERLSATRLQLLDICGVRLPEVPVDTD